MFPTNKKNIFPTPVIGGVGIIKNVKNKITHSLKKEEILYYKLEKLLDIFTQSVLFEEIYSINEGPPPEINLTNEKNNGEANIKTYRKKILC